ncbi:hypothetical protein BT63DRAFT_450882 [Microthyrium microscopicum]|uniref:Uncharacterized protein n=1 Tax=Microthyrium microscopicum TaxID=703497 RepID=A0A6A6UP49_9PEZI|nr:hypothetical protein BT63DRAFT_450882 [Microthyrium microscopicum]
MTSRLPESAYGGLLNLTHAGLTRLCKIILEYPSQKPAGIDAGSVGIKIDNALRLLESYHYLYHAIPDKAPCYDMSDLPKILVAKALDNHVWIRDDCLWAFQPEIIISNVCFVNALFFAVIDIHDNPNTNTVQCANRANHTFMFEYFPRLEAKWTAARARANKGCANSIAHKTLLNCDHWLLQVGSFADVVEPGSSHLPLLISNSEEDDGHDIQISVESEDEIILDNEEANVEEEHELGLGTWV